MRRKARAPGGSGPRAARAEHDAQRLFGSPRPPTGPSTRDRRSVLSRPPPRSASERARRRWASRRASAPGDPPAGAVGRGGPRIEAGGHLQDHPGLPGGAVLEVRGQLLADLLGAAEPTLTAMPAARSCSTPRPATWGSGSSTAMTTRATPAAMMASVQGGVRPWWAHGSRVVNRVAPGRAGRRPGPTPLFRRAGLPAGRSPPRRPAPDHGRRR